ncbi:DUF5007 domain-containing protein [Niabella beijingensis]|uniref:DUF5007 domain-containing protein n=1 Tax=Niabella beijingensis TaxID=2872700 RepID=UPI001CBDA9AE|nr:DUF5007 domain-containing protein [Niabella beijingensis]MBZ4191040.1 DUF5007 domain-containing protein [Niabella beijingensis]
MNRFFLAGLLVLGLVSAESCKKLLPDDRNAIDPAATYLTTNFSPILGRNYIARGAFSFGESTLPMEFEVLNLRRFNGEPAPELTQDIYPVTVWKTTGAGAYTGFEKSIAEIEAKRTIENHRILEVRKSSGDIVVWGDVNSSKLITRPDSGYVFDVKVSNSGATRYFYNLRFMPYKPVPHDPHNYNLNTGMASSPALTSGTSGISLTNFVRSRDNVSMSVGEVDVYFNKLTGGSGNSLTFKFLDSSYSPINPKLFNQTKWDKLVHGFDMKLTDTEVKYTVAYPIPLVQIPTTYTNSAGNRANVQFSYYRLGPGGFGVTATLGFNFAIYQKGDWEIAFHFKNTSPKFTND